MKNLLSVDEQIEHMKQKGITFNYVSEDDAKVFLSRNNYYMKLAAYRSTIRIFLHGFSLSLFRLVHCCILALFMVSITMICFSITL